MIGHRVHDPGQGERHVVGPNSTVVIKATGAETANGFYLHEATLEPGFIGPPPHRHERIHDMFYVLEGTLTVQIEDEQHAIAAGGFVCIPPGVTHTFSNPGSGTVRVLNFNTPGGWEHYMRELGDAAEGGKLSSEAMGQIASRFDFRIV